MMETEINSQSEIIGNLIEKYIQNYCFVLNIPAQTERVVIIASGSSYNAGLYGKYFFENIANIDCKVEYSAEFSQSKFNDYDKNALYIFISQSGNSKDTVEALLKVKEKGIKTLCIVNNKDSKMYNNADFCFDIQAGVENAIAATKTFSASVVMLWLIACKAAQNKHINLADEMKNIYSIKNSLDMRIENIENLKMAAKIITKQKDFSICGLGYNFPLAKETALKIKETSYINTSAYPLGEFIHGHFALLNKSKAFLAFITEDYEDVEIELLNKIFETYKTKSIIISDSWKDINSTVFVKLSKKQSRIASIVSMIITMQFLTLEVAKRLKRDVDRPQGLTKVVR